MNRYILIIITAVVCSACSGNVYPATFRPHHSHHYRPHTTIVVTPPKAKITHNHLSHTDRLKMAISYLRSNKYLKVKKYAKMTGLSTEMAETELNAFAMDSNIPITFSMQGKKKTYILIH